MKKESGEVWWPALRQRILWLLRRQPIKKQPGELWWLSGILSIMLLLSAIFLVIKPEISRYILRPPLRELFDIAGPMPVAFILLVSSILTAKWALDEYKEKKSEKCDRSEASSEAVALKAVAFCLVKKIKSLICGIRHRK